MAPESWFFYMLDARIASGKTKNLTAAKALAQLERAFNLSEGSAQDFLLVDLARTDYISLGFSNLSLAPGGRSGGRRAARYIPEPRRRRAAGRTGRVAPSVRIAPANR